MTNSIDLVAVGSWSSFDHIFGVERIPAPGETIRITSGIERVGSMTWGGCAPNNAAAACRLGFSTGLVSVVGEDYVSHGYFGHFESLGVDQRGVKVVGGSASGHSFLFTDPAGVTICISHLGIAETQDSYHPDAGVIREARAVVLNYKFDEFTLEAARLAKASGALVTTSGALSTSPELAGPIASCTDVVFCTRSELEMLVATLHLNSVEALFELGPRALIQTEGRRGSRIITEDGEERIPAVKAARVVDPVGAGDAFVGVAAAFMGRDATMMRKAVQAGATAASFVVEEWGAQTALPDWTSFETRYQATFREPPLAIQ